MFIQPNIWTQIIFDSYSVPGWFAQEEGGDHGQDGSDRDAGGNDGLLGVVHRERGDHGQDGHEQDGGDRDAGGNLVPWGLCAVRGCWTAGHSSVWLRPPSHQHLPCQPRKLSWSGNCQPQAFNLNPWTHDQASGKNTSAVIVDPRVLTQCKIGGQRKAKG